ncbi:MAG: excinuclease ABC subunit UvrA, partial [Chloroflexota bacterium]
MSQENIVVVGAREHNLKNITVEIPRDKLVVITGLSGSGKSSLAFDTIFAEGQRRYVESLSAYARQFLGQLEKPDVDRIDGLSPAVAIDQKGVSHNPRSTVGTVTETYDYLRLLFARAGTPHCPKCGRLVQKQSAEQIVDAVTAMPEGAKFMILAPLIKDRKGHHQSVFEDARKLGYARVRVDGQVRDVEEEIELDRYKMHTIEAVVDRLVVKSAKERSEEAKEFLSRVTDSVETALRLGGGTIIVNRLTANGGEDHLFSEHFACPFDGTNLPDIEPRTFSFNSPHGACPACQGLGTKMEIDPDLIVPNKELSIEDGAVAVMEWRSREEGGYYWQTLEAAAKHYKIPLDEPFGSLTATQAKIILYGSGGEKIRLHYKSREGRTGAWDTAYEGVINNLKRRYQETTSQFFREKIEEFLRYNPCDECRGLRLRP